jgi:hypothetical protein
VGDLKDDADVGVVLDRLTLAEFVRVNCHKIKTGVPLGNPAERTSSLPADELMASVQFRLRSL